MSVLTVSAQQSNLGNADSSGAEDSFLITDVWLGNSLISNDAMVFYQGGNLYLPFSFLKNTLRISINFDARQEVYTGWIYNEITKIYIDFRAKTASVNGDSYVIYGDDMIKTDGEIYFKASFIERIFKLKITFNYSEQSIYIETLGGNLPVQVKQMTAKNRKLFDAEKSAEQSDLALSDNTIIDNSFISPPFLDLSARYSFDKRKDTPAEHFVGYSANAFAVTGGFDSEVYVYDMASHSPATIALKTSKYNPEGDLLGIFRKLELGDVYSFSNSAVTYSQSGRGFKLSTYSDDVLEGKVFNIRDVLPLGWEVEIYRNGELLGYQNSN